MHRFAQDTCQEENDFKTANSVQTSFKKLTHEPHPHQGKHQSETLGQQVYGQPCGDEMRVAEQHNNGDRVLFCCVFQETWLSSLRVATHVFAPHCRSPGK